MLAPQAILGGYDQASQNENAQEVREIEEANTWRSCVISVGQPDGGEGAHGERARQSLEECTPTEADEDHVVERVQVAAFKDENQDQSRWPAHQVEEVVAED